MLSKNIFIKSYINNFEKIETKKLNIINNNIIKIRSFFINTINKIYPKEEAIFL
jgi:hypothetical protein